MQEPHHRDHHHPARLILTAGAAALALTLAGSARAAHFAALPSPVAPLSESPPLGGGATSSTETKRHTVTSSTAVRVSVDPSGTPFAVVATQRLEVGVLGDYFFTIAAPALAVEAAAGSASTPGLRTGSIIWAGFNPGRRRLAARVTLDARRVRSSLPLRVEVSAGHVTLVDATTVGVGTFTADALRPSLVAYLRRLEAAAGTGTLPAGGSAQVTSTPVAARVTVTAPLRVTGTVGGRPVSLVLTGRRTIPASGRIDLRVTPLERVRLGDLSALGGRQLLDLATHTTLTLARTRQYEQFLGNPDPTGRSATTYVYRSAKRPAPPVAAAPRAHGSALETWLVAAALVAALGVATVVWARS